MKAYAGADIQLHTSPSGQLTPLEKSLILTEHRAAWVTNPVLALCNRKEDVMKFQVFWDVTQCRLVSILRRFDISSYFDL
jgi:hypothetical protein